MTEAAVNPPVGEHSTVLTNIYLGKSEGQNGEAHPVFGDGGKVTTEREHREFLWARQASVWWIWF